MPRPPKKKQYTEKKHRAIYVILNSLTKEFYIDYTLDEYENLRSAYKEHYTGKRNKTREMILKMRAQENKPCYFILEKVYDTKVETYRYVIAWTKVFIEQGYVNLDRGDIIGYTNDLFGTAKTIYENRQTVNVNKVFTCENCVFPNYGRTPCTLKKRGEQNAKKYSAN